MRLLLAVAFVCASPLPNWAQESIDQASSSVPKKTPVLRTEMKSALELLKTRQPRLPLPAAAEGERSVNNGRARNLYLPESWRAGQGGNQPRPTSDGAARSEPAAAVRPADPAMTLDNTFKVRLFWIVSRVNNCQY